MNEIERLSYMLVSASIEDKKRIEKIILEKKISFCVGKEITFPEFRGNNFITGTIVGVKKSYNDEKYYCIVENSEKKINLKNLNVCYEILRNKADSQRL